MCRLAIGVGQVASLAHEASEHRILLPRIAPHHRVLGGERNDALAPAVEVWVAFDDNAAGTERSNRLERRLVQLNLGTRMNYIELDTESTRCVTNRLAQRSGSWDFAVSDRLLTQPITEVNAG